MHSPHQEQGLFVGLRCPAPLEGSSINKPSFMGWEVYWRLGRGGGGGHSKDGWKAQKEEVAAVQGVWEPWTSLLGAYWWGQGSPGSVFK